MIIVFVFFGVYKLVQYAEYTEEYSYELQEIKDGTYAIYHSVSSNVPANNYDVVTICYNGQIHMFQGEVIIQQTNDTPYVNIIRKPHMNNADEITVFIPKGAIEFIDNVGLKQAQIHGFIQEVVNIDVLKFLVTRPDDTVLVYLMKNESDNTYSFVNITRWHICPCRFQSIRDAVADMDRLKEEGKIIRYEFTN